MEYTVVWTTDPATKDESCILAFHDRPGSTEEEVLWPVPKHAARNRLGAHFLYNFGDYETFRYNIWLWLPDLSILKHQYQMPSPACLLCGPFAG